MQVDNKPTDPWHWLAQSETVAEPATRLAALSRAVAAAALARGWTGSTPGFARALAEIGEALVASGHRREARRVFSHAVSGRALCVAAQSGMARTSEPA